MMMMMTTMITSMIITMTLVTLVLTMTIFKSSYMTSKQAMISFDGHTYSWLQLTLPMFILLIMLLWMTTMSVVVLWLNLKEDANASLVMFVTVVFLEKNTVIWKPCQCWCNAADAHVGDVPMLIDVDYLCLDDFRFQIEFQREEIHLWTSFYFFAKRNSIAKHLQQT